MHETDARRILGISESAGADDARTAYRARLLRTHPDVSGSGDATERTVELTRAYRLLVRVFEPDVSPGPVVDARVEAPAASPVPNSAPDAGPSAGPFGNVSEQAVEPVLIAQLDGDTIGVGAPPNETLMLLVEAAYRLGEISYLDRSAGLLEIVVEFIEAPTSSVLLSLQGRATGITEVFCTVEPLSGGKSPPADAVTRLLLHTLLDVTAAG